MKGADIGPLLSSTDDPGLVSDSVNKNSSVQGEFLQEMSEGLDQGREIIRKIIFRHKGYDLKENLNVLKKLYRLRRI